MPKPPQQDFQFISKLHEVINSDQTNTVGWDTHGKGFIVNDQRKFTKEILVQNFGIGRFDSFARKLNKYGFKRSKVDKQKIRFFHNDFTKDRKLIHKIRKLNKQETLPKHIKLQLIRERLKQTNSIKQQQFGNINSKSQNSQQKLHQAAKTQISNQTFQHSSTPAPCIDKTKRISNLKEDIDIYFMREPEMGIFNTWKMKESIFD